MSTTARAHTGHRWPWLLTPIGALLTLAALTAAPAIDYRLPAEASSPLGNPFHFWMISAAGLLALVVGVLMSEAARRRDDARVLLLALGLLTAAAAVLLHALATPNVLIEGRNIGFVVAAPVGMVGAAIFIAAAARDMPPHEARLVVAWQGLLRALVLGGWALFALLAMLRLPPLSLIPDLEVVDTPLLFCVVGVLPAPAVQWPASAALIAATGLYAFAAWRFLGRSARQGDGVALALGGACALLAVTALNVGLARTWRLSWWQWHLLVMVAFGLLAFAVWRQYRREGSARPIFDSLYLEETVQRIRGEYGAALEALVGAFQRRAEQPDEATPAVDPAVAQQFGLSAGQAAVLERAAEALAAERAQIERLAALAAISQASSVIEEEAGMLARALGRSAAAFRDLQLQVGLVQAGQLTFSPALRAGLSLPADEALRGRLLGQALREGRPAEEGGLLALPLLVKGRAVGLLEVRRARGPFAERDRSLLLTLAGQLSVALENTRLYRQIDQLFRQYMPASVATALIADPSQAALGGAVREISVLFGDLRGFTALSERLDPPALVALLNRYYRAAGAAVLAEGGTIDKFMGDAMMALFNAPASQADHALRACRAALAMQRAIAPIAAESSDMPRFGIGVNTGPALVGNIGSDEIRNFTAIGDTVNLASRLQSRADGGQVLINASTYALVRAQVEAQPIGQILVKGKEGPVEAFILLGVR